MKKVKLATLVGACYHVNIPVLASVTIYHYRVQE